MKKELMFLVFALTALNTYTMEEPTGPSSSSKPNSKGMHYLEKSLEGLDIFDAVDKVINTLNKLNISKDLPQKAKILYNALKAGYKNVLRETYASDVLLNLKKEDLNIILYYTLFGLMIPIREGTKTIYSITEDQEDLIARLIIAGADPDLEVHSKANVPNKIFNCFITEIFDSNLLNFLVENLNTKLIPLLVFYGADATQM